MKRQTLLMIAATAAMMTGFPFLIGGLVTSNLLATVLGGSLSAAGVALESIRILRRRSA